MSGVVALFRRDGREIETPEIQGMLDTLTHRGTDSSGLWADGPAALGHRMRWNTPESICDHMPRVHWRNRAVLSADVRLDNRDELMALLSIVPGAGDLTDSELILAAWERWGGDCPAKLEGDFSFVLWDPTTQTMFCARDAVGVRSLYYFESGKLFAAASEIKALIRHADIPCELNELRVGDHLINLFDDRSITFYRNILRLPGGSSLTVTRDRAVVRKYWSLDPQKEVWRRSSEEYAEAFKEKFDNAVRCRLRTAFPVGSALSGGLDSSAVACTARKILQASSPGTRLQTYSVVFPGAPSQERATLDERKFIDKILSQGDYRAHFIQGDELSPLRDVDRIHHHCDEANFAPNLYLHWAMFKSAAANGVRVFLDGFDGDSTVSHGFEYLEELLRGFRWVRLRKELRLLSGNLFENSSPRRILWNYCLKEMAPLWMHRIWRLAHGRFREIRANSSLLHPEFEERLQFRERARAASESRARPRLARDHHCRALNFPLYSHALETADKAGAAFGIEPAYPFFDRRLMEFCLALPASQKLGDGWNRVVLRRAMRNVLPPEIQWRASKGNLSSNFHRNLMERDGNTIRQVIEADASPVESYVDRAAMRRSFALCQANPSGEGGKHSIQLFAAVNLALWMRGMADSKAQSSKPAEREQLKPVC